MSSSGDLLPLAVRAYARPPLAEDANTRAKPRSARRRRALEPARRPPAVLVIDCETTTDATQALLFGCYRYYRLDCTAAGPEPVCVEEGIFHADELAACDPAASACLAEYAATRPAAVTAAVDDAVGTLQFRSRTEFCEQVLWAALSAEATVVGFNLPFDLSRLAVECSEARSKRFAGGFSFTLFTYTDKDGVERENRYRPRLLIRALDSKRARIALGSVRPGADPDAAGRGQGAFLDLRTLAYALTGEGHSLESACDAFGVPFRKREVAHGQITPTYLDYCREDVAATAELYRALACEYERWGLQLAPTRAYSPASLAKAQLREAGIRPLLERQPDFPAEAIGQSLVAYYGGRAECRVRRKAVPVAYLDFLSMYPTVCALLELWRFLRCGHIDIVDEDVRRFEHRLAKLTLDDCFEPTFWPTLCGFALLHPDDDVLPVRARYSIGGNFGIGVNPLTSDEPLWYSLADVVAARLLTGRTPRLLKVVRLKPAGRGQRLRPLSVRGSRPIDPNTEDLFRVLVEERHRLEQLGDDESQRTAAALKVVASAVSYGIFVELNRQEPAGDPIPLTVHGLDSFEATATAAEEPGVYFYPPLAALVTGAARLMLALLESCVTDAGSSYAFCDTDSMAILATRAGGLVPCPGGSERYSRGRECLRVLSWADIDAIVERFTALNPYDCSLVPGSILELEPENFDPDIGERRQLDCYAISAKRYCLYTYDDHGEPQLVKPSEHGLGGFYLNPTNPDEHDRDWVRETWELIVHTEALGLAGADPAWFDRPAITRFTATHPRLLRPFAEVNAGKPYSEQIKPFNFLLVAHVAPGGHPRGVDPKQFALAAPYEPDPRRWQQLAWHNVHDPPGPTYTISGETLISRRGRPLPPGRVGVKSYRDVTDAYRIHPEPKSLGPDRRPCTRRTIGLLSRRPVQALLPITHVGKETNLLDELQAGLVGEESEALVEYSDARQDQWTLVVGVLRTMRQGKTAAAAGIHRDTFADLVAGRSRPQPGTRERLTLLAVAHARSTLIRSCATATRDDRVCLIRYLREQPSRHDE